MNIFNIKMLFQHTNWWSVLTFVKIYLITYVAYKLLKFMKEYVQSLQRCSIPGIRGNLLYPQLLISVFKKNTPECPAICVAFRTLMGYCLLYGKDGLFIGNLLFKQGGMFFKAEAVEAVLSSTEHIDKSSEYRLMRQWIGNGLITSQGTKWRRQRKLLTPTFHFSILKDCLPVFQDQANILNSKIKSRIQEPWVDIVPLIYMYTLDVICETAMGVSMNIQKGRNCDYLNATLEIEEAVMYRGMRPWLYPDIIFNLTTLGKRFNSNLLIVHQLSKKIMKQKLDKIKNKDCYSTFDDKSNEYSIKKNERKPFLELLLEYHLKDPSFTEEHVREEVDTFMFAGHDTVAAGISWALYCLGLYPEVQRQVHDELDAIFGNEMKEKISPEDLGKMKYLECVIKESLRLYPPVPFIARENKQSFKAVNRIIKEGTFCIISFWELHRDPKIFPNPEKFIPERFLPESCIGRHPYVYAPFSAGPRNCIGQKFALMEMKTVLACILKQFKVKSLDPRDKVLVYPNLVIRNAHPLRLTFERR